MEDTQVDQRIIYLATSYIFKSINFLAAFFHKDEHRVTSIAYVVDQI